MKIKIKGIAVAAFIYMYSAMAVFFAGWLRPAWAIGICVVLGIGFILGMRSWCHEMEDTVFLSKRTLCIGVLLVLFFCWHTGIGAFTGQAGDWMKHNAVMHDLAEKEWPVIYQTDYGESMLCYYTGFYLLPAIAGKIFGSFRAAELAQYALAAAGIFLLWILVIKAGEIKSRKGQILCLGLLFVFSSGMLPLGQTVCGSLYPDNFPFGSHEWMNPETVRIQYTSNWSLLKWVPGQAVVPWLATVLLLLRPHKTQNYVLIGLPVLLYSGFAMVGVAAMMLAVYLCDIVQGRWQRAKKAFSASNILLAAAGCVQVFYFWGNISGSKPEYLGFHWLDYGKKPEFYFIFCFFMFGFYALLLFKENRKNYLYWITIAALSVYPRFSMGLYNDFTMRTSIPALFVLMILILRFLGLQEERDKSLTIRKTLLVAGLVIGAFYPFLNLRESITKNEIGEIYRTDGYGTLEQLADPSNEDIQDDWKYNYYTYDLENDFFYKYLARRK